MVMMIQMTIKEQLEELLAEAGITVPDGGFDAEMSLREQGLDSLDMYSLFLEVEKKFGVHVDSDEMGDLGSLSAIEAHIVKQKAAQ